MERSVHTTRSDSYTYVLRAFLAIESTRPLYGRVADHNAASAKVLARRLCRDGLRDVVRARSCAEVVERIYRLDR